MECGSEPWRCISLSRATLNFYEPGTGQLLQASKDFDIHGVVTQGG